MFDDEGPSRHVAKFGTKQFEEPSGVFVRQLLHIVEDLLCLDRVTNGFSQITDWVFHFVVNVQEPIQSAVNELSVEFHRSNIVTRSYQKSTKNKTPSLFGDGVELTNKMIFNGLRINPKRSHLSEDYLFPHFPLPAREVMAKIAV